MPRGEPTVQKWLNVEQAKLVGKSPGKARLTVSELELVESGRKASPMMGEGESGRNPTTSGMPEPRKVVEVPSIEVPAVTSSPILRHDERQALRSRLDAYKEEYLDAARRQDWDTCTRVNQDREPLFYELWKLESGLPPEKRFWFPARVMNQGHVFRPELTRKTS